jgi:hypothetical protein
MFSLLGAAMFAAVVFWRVPNAQDLIENKCELRSFYILHQSNLPWFPTKSKNWYNTVWYTADGRK